MKIVGIKGSFRTEMGWVFPTHPDFHLLDFSVAKNTKNVDAYIQTNVLGHFKNNVKDQHDFIASTGKPRIVIEQAPFRKNQDIDKSDTYYYKVGLNHFTYDEGIFKNENSPSDRWDKISKDLDIQIKPWQNKKYDNSQYILFLLQNPIDTSLNSLVSHTPYDHWIKTTIDQIQSITDKKIKVRLHPRFLKKFNLDLFKGIKNLEVSQNYQGFNKTNGGQALYEDFKNAWAVVSYSSNGLTESVCEGIPTITLHKSGFSWPVSYHNLDILKKDKIECDFNRTQWLYDCAYTQWTLEEINKGIVHRRLLNDYNS